MRELSIGKRLSTRVKAMIKEKEFYLTQEVKSKVGTGVGAPNRTGLRVNEWGPKEKVYQSSINEVSPKGKKRQ